ncbi:MAG: [protein-PII] uridylyltransferase [Cardiobacteriaceae bacterium]|nr:[protein-PII] uridylyltransferase [Cardiobacteriaceae bacterium]
MTTSANPVQDQEANTINLMPDWQPSVPALPLHEEAERARDYLRQLRTSLAACTYALDYDVRRLIAHYTKQVDRILIALYQQIIHSHNIRLYAIGGYGRAELFPLSDIDILIMMPDKIEDIEHTNIETYIQTLWLLGLDIAQHVYRQSELDTVARADTDLLTSLLENRQLTGTPYLIDPSQPPLIAPAAYIQLKQKERRVREKKQEENGQLEPNIKDGNGGLRDLQMIDWLSAYCYHDHSHVTLINKNLLTANESSALYESRDALWRIRFVLHLNNAHAKNTLDFEQQKDLAQRFGYHDQRNYLAIEQLMHHYYRHSMRIRRINQRVISLIEADHQPPQPVLLLTANYASKNDKLILRHEENLKKHPQQLWDIFRYLQQNPTIHELHPDLVRHIRRHRENLINAAYRRDADIRRQFLELLAHPGNVYPQIQRIHQYGLLYRYIPAFAYIMGRMQYDLFHQYTVDQHTLKLLDYLDRFVHPAPAYPQAAEIIAHLKKPAILYLAALFHDIGKGYDGDHSEIGAQIADLYARENDAISPEERDLLVYLVKHHLDLSLTAQKKDLADPETIAEFAARFPQQDYLDYLYLLTIADISATNRFLWNSWRASLIHNLYQQTKHLLAHDTNSLHAQQYAERERARTLILTAAPNAIEQLWAQLPETFFRGENAAHIAQKSAQLLTRAGEHAVSQIETHPPRLFISSPNPADILFARITHFLEKNDHNIHEARLYSNADHSLTIQQYTLSETPSPAPNLTRKLEDYIHDNRPPSPLGKRLNRTPLKYFNPHTHIDIRHDPRQKRTTLELSCKDRHGLLSLISRILLEHHIHISHAKIGTYGEKVEDSFHLTDAQHQPLTDPAALAKLKQSLLAALQ